MTTDWKPQIQRIETESIALLVAIKTHRIHLLTIYVVITNIGRSIKSQNIIFVLLFCLSSSGLPLHNEVPSVKKLLP